MKLLRFIYRQILSFLGLCIFSSLEAAWFYIHYFSLIPLEFFHLHLYGLSKLPCLVKALLTLVICLQLRLPRHLGTFLGYFFHRAGPFTLLFLHLALQTPNDVPFHLFNGPSFFFARGDDFNAGFLSSRGRDDVIAESYLLAIGFPSEHLLLLGLEMR